MCIDMLAGTVTDPPIYSINIKLPVSCNQCSGIYHTTYFENTKVRESLEKKFITSKRYLVWRLKAFNIYYINSKAVTQMWGLKSKYTATQVLHSPSQVKQSEKIAIFFVILRTRKKPLFHKNAIRQQNFLPCVNNVWPTMLFARLSNHQHLSKCLYKL